MFDTMSIIRRWLLERSQPFEDAESDAPHDCGLIVKRRNVRGHRLRVLAHLCFADLELAQGNPVSRSDLLVEGQLRSGIEQGDEDRDRKVARLSVASVVRSKSADDVAVIGDVESHLLAGLPQRRLEKSLVVRLMPASRQADMAGPLVAGIAAPAHEQQLVVPDAGENSSVTSGLSRVGMWTLREGTGDLVGTRERRGHGVMVSVTVYPQSEPVTAPRHSHRASVNGPMFPTPGTPPSRNTRVAATMNRVRARVPLRIDTIEIRQVAMPLREPWRTASHSTTAIHAIFARLESGGVSAWGESAPLSDPTFSPEWSGGAFPVLETWLAPTLLGEEIDSGEELQARLHMFKGNYFAKAALDCAWWALDAKLAGVPLHRHVGGVRDRVEIGADFGVADSLDTLINQIGEALDQGFRRVKLKFRPGWDVSMVEAVRSNYPNLACHVDCNSAYTLDDLDLFRRLDSFGLVMIEQPLAFDDLHDHAKLAKAIDTPICLDESIVSTDRARHAIELEACGWINLKHGRLGGITNTIAVNEICRDAGVKCWVGSMLESAVGSALSTAIGSREWVHYPADIFTTERLYDQDHSHPEIDFEVGADGGVFAMAANAPGILPEPHPERPEERTISRVVLAAD